MPPGRLACAARAARAALAAAAGATTSGATSCVLEYEAGERQTHDIVAVVEWNIIDASL